VQYTYILKCADGTLYCGSTNDLEKRVHLHNHSKAGAKYTRGRRPVTLVYSERFRSLAKARAREAALKRLTREEKLAIIKG
jgi:putative endonuclease